MGAHKLSRCSKHPWPTQLLWWDTVAFGCVFGCVPCSWGVSLLLFESHSSMSCLSRFPILYDIQFLSVARLIILLFSHSTLLPGFPLFRSFTPLPRLVYHSCTRIVNQARKNTCVLLPFQSLAWLASLLLFHATLLPGFPLLCSFPPPFARLPSLLLFHPTPLPGFTFFRRVAFRTLYPGWVSSTGCKTQGGSGAVTCAWG